jgi:hypothetical protein
MQLPVTVSSQDSIPVAADTTTVCVRNSIEDVTFYDSANLVLRIDPARTGKFPFLFTEKNKIIQDEIRATVVRHLKPGNELQYQPLHEDWIILIILAASFLFALIRNSSVNFLHGVERFFLFRGINDPASRDIGGLFSWESTIKNLIAFLSLGLYGYAAASLYDTTPPALPGILLWGAIVAGIIVTVTLRHLVCLVTGSVSDEREVFMEYLISIYQFYRFSGLVIFVITILMLYTTIIPGQACLKAGLAVLVSFYLIRVTRLFIIFINKNISLFYLILYLCALEILPVVISVKYISGLI